MTNKEIKIMLSVLVAEIDHDVWKSYFLKSHDEGDQEKKLNRLVSICEKHLKKEKK